MTQNKNIKIAITGGIGSGKSTVCHFIKKEGLPVVSCDEIYAELCTRQDFLRVLSKEFGNILTDDGKLDRKKLSDMVFHDKAALNRLNALAHPAITEELFNRAKNFKLCFCEVPLLFESGLQGHFDEVLIILRNREDRIKSIVQRDKISDFAADLRIKSQFDYDKCSFAQYYVIHNDGNLVDLRQKTLHFIEEVKLRTL